MRTCAVVLVLVALVSFLPAVAWTAPVDSGVREEIDTAPRSPRDTSRFVLLGGLGVPDLVYIEADYSIWRGLAVTARAGGLPPLVNRFSVGLLGLLPLSSDTALVPRQSLGLQVEFSSMAVINFNFPGDDRVYLAGERPDDRAFHTSIGPTVSAGYLFTSLGGLHLRVMGGAFFPVSGDLSTPVPNLQLGIGKL